MNLARETIKRWFFRYQKAMWYSAQTGSEIAKPLRFMDNVVLLATFLTVKGYNFGLWTMIVVFIAVSLVSIIIGRILANVGVVRFNAQLSNVQSPELMAILKIVKRIDGRVEKLEKNEHE